MMKLNLRFLFRVVTVVTVNPDWLLSFLLRSGLPTVPTSVWLSMYVPPWMIMMVCGPMEATNMFGLPTEMLHPTVRMMAGFACSDKVVW